MARPMRIVEYVVEGKGPFPVDMLRYDCSYPARGADAVNLVKEADNPWPQGEVRTVVLRHRDVYVGWSPTAGRWSSFGWLVTTVREWVA